MKTTRQHSAFLIIGIFLLGASMRTPFTSIPSVINEIAASFHTPATSLGSIRQRSAAFRCKSATAHGKRFPGS